MVSQVGAWSTRQDSVDPSGVVSPGAGDDRAFVYLTGHRGDSYVITTFTIDGAAADFVYENNETNDTPDTFLFAHVWLESTIAAWGTPTIAYSATAAGTLHTSHYATFEDVHQTTPVTEETSVWNASTDNIDVATPGGATKFTLLNITRTSNARDITDWDNLSEVVDAAIATGLRYCMGQGSTSDTTTTLTGDGFAGSYAVQVLSLEPLAITSLPGYHGANRGIMRGISRGIT